MLTVILAEKDQQAKEYALALGEVITSDKIFIVKKTPYFEGEVHILASEGHLFDYEAPKDNWSMDNLPLLDVSFKQHLKEDKKSKTYFSRIYKEVMSCDQVVIGTDSDREGERIAYSILGHIPSGIEKITKRLWVSSLSQKGLEQAFQNLRDPKETYNYYLEAEARAQSDWLVGMNLSPLVTLELQRQGSLARKKGNSLSVGRVQTAVVRLICENDVAISHFQPETYYKFKLEDRETGIAFTCPKKIESSDEALALSREFKEVSKVVAIETKLTKVPAPALFNLSDLQEYASSHWKFSGDKTLALVESLYLKKYLSYPRTDCRFITLFEFESLKTHLSSYQALLGTSFDLAYPEARESYVSDSEVAKKSHYALIPTETIPNLLSLSSDERLIYDLVTRRTILMFASDHSYETQTVQVSNNGFIFKASGRRLVTKGWQEWVTQALKKDIALPDYKVDDVFSSHITVDEGRTQAPKRITEGYLIGQLLPKYGLGTSATRAEMIKLIQEKGYVTKDKTSNQFTPTSKAFLLIDYLYDNEFSIPQTTAGWEHFLSQIGEGEVNPREFVDAIKEKLNHQIMAVKKGD